MPWIVLSALVLLALAWRWRLQLTRAFVLALLNTVYRIHVRGLENVPEGGALLVGNHLSHADALFVGAAVPRRVDFLMHRAIFRAPLVGAFAKLFDTIPVASGDTPEQKAESLARAAERVRQGSLVCIFGEGAISRTGHMLFFKHGLETIARSAGRPIVPVALDRVWGSIFSFSAGRVLWKLPRRLPYPIDVRIARPLPATATAWEVRDALAEELAAAREERSRASRSLSYRFVRSARKHSGRVALVDADGRRTTYAELLRRVLALAAVLRREFPAEERLGVLLPAGSAGVTASLALTLAGKTSVHLDPDSSAEARAEQARTAALAHVLDARLLAELESRVTARERRRARLVGWLPGPLAARRVDPEPAGARPLTVQFTGVARRAVVLTHANLASNVQSLSQIFSLSARDRLLGVHPFFQAFGYSANLWLPLLSGASTVFARDALDVAAIAELARAERPSLVIATPSVFRAWERGVGREAFSGLRLALCGAEPLPAELADAWLAKFGTPLYAGYGATELAPVATANVPDFERGGAHQIGNKPGTVGRALPGVALRVVDPASFELLPPDREGLLLVRGPNVMAGYLGEPGESARVLRAGWFVTGDRGKLDRDGFLTISGRSSAPAAS